MWGPLPPRRGPLPPRSQPAPAQRWAREDVAFDPRFAESENVKPGIQGATDSIGKKKKNPQISKTAWAWALRKAGNTHAWERGAVGLWGALPGCLGRRVSTFSPAKAQPQAPRGGPTRVLVRHQLTRGCRIRPAGRWPHWPAAFARPSGAQARAAAAASTFRLKRTRVVDSVLHELCRDCGLTSKASSAG